MNIFLICDEVFQIVNILKIYDEDFKGTTSISKYTINIFPKYINNYFLIYDDHFFK